MEIKLKTLLSIVLIAISTSAAFASNLPELRLASPNGKQEVVFRQKVSGAIRELMYTTSYAGKEVIAESRAGLDLDNRVWELALAKKIQSPKCWMDNLEADSVSYRSSDTSWHPLYGERSTIRDNYNEGTLYLSKKDGSDYRLNVIVRAYDEGIAFRYFFPEHPEAIFHKVIKDLTDYTFASGTKAWATEWAQGTYSLVDINDMPHNVERALTIELSNGLWASLADADVDDWCQTLFRTSQEKKNTLASIMYSIVDVVTYASTPWKVILTGEKPGDLVENNDLILNLNEPCRIESTDWIKPGHLFRDIILTTESAYKAIDFCVERKIPSVLFCWKWYMPVTSHDGDALVAVDKFDVHSAINYAKQKNIDVWLYINQHALQKPNIDSVLETIRSWGVVGIKPGFVEYCSHRWAVWVHDIVRLAAKHELMVNIHDEFRPSGFSRTYPNLITQEGIRGNEEYPDATHNTVLPFTRMINGAADYTINYYDNQMKNTHAHQLALAVTYYSPSISLFWRDTPDRYKGEPELEWFENIPNTYDDSRILDGYPGKFATTARRNGIEWYVGTITNNDASSQDINLSFLEKDQTYLAQIYTDGGDEINTRTKVRISYLLVDAKQTMRFNLKPRGGAAIRLIPVSGKTLKEYKKYRGQTL